MSYRTMQRLTACHGVDGSRQQRVTPKLAVILAADVVGYSRLWTRLTP